MVEGTAGTAGARQERIKLAELTSTVGAGVIGAGIALLLNAYLADLAIPILILGLVAHAWGMMDKHAIEERTRVERVWWSIVLYWACWVALAALALYAVVRALTAG